MILSCLQCTVLLACAATAAAQTVRYDEGVYPLEAYATPRDGGSWVACRIVDAVTGKPIVGAELLLVEESKAPVPGQFAFVRKVNSDADGFAALPLGESASGWTVARAPGHGPSSCSSGAPHRVWALQPGIDVPVQLRDWLDRPVPGAGIGLCLGCGHTPDVANATADANGIAIVRGIDIDNDIADFYPEHPDLGLDGYDGVDWVPGDAPAILRASYGEPVRGQLLDAGGQPVAGGFVGTKNKHRGPWTACRADGSFQLDGTEPGDDLFVVLPDRLDHEYLFERPWQQPATLQLPVANDESCQVIDLPRPAGQKGVLQVRIEDAAAAPLAQLALTYVGPLPLRFRQDDQTDRDGKADFELAAGTYEVHCSDRRYEELVGTVVVKAGVTTAPMLRPAPLPTVHLDVPDGCKVAVMHRGVRDDVTDLVAADRAVPIPSSGVFGLHISNADDERVVTFTTATALQQQPLRLRLLPPTQIVARCTGADGEPVAVRVALLSRQEWRHGDEHFDPMRFKGSAATDGAIALTSRGVGTHVLALRPQFADLQPSLRPLLLPVSLPPRAEAVKVDLGTLQLPTAPCLRIVTAEGKPYGGPAPGWLRQGWQDVREAPAAMALDADGGWLGIELRAPDVIVVPTADWDLQPDVVDGIATVVMPFRTVLQGSAPWRIVVPAGELQLEVADAAGQPLKAVAFVADRSIDLDGRVVLRQLPAGELEVVVAAEGRKTAFAKVAVPATGRGVLKLTLPPL